MVKFSNRSIKLSNFFIERRRFYDQTKGVRPVVSGSCSTKSPFFESVECVITGSINGNIYSGKSS